MFDYYKQTIVHVPTLLPPYTIEMLLEKPTCKMYAKYLPVSTVISAFPTKSHEYRIDSIEHRPSFTLSCATCRRVGISALCINYGRTIYHFMFCSICEQATLAFRDNIQMYTLLLVRWLLVALTLGIYAFDLTQF